MALTQTRQIAKINSSPNFSAIRYMSLQSQSTRRINYTCMWCCIAGLQGLKLAQVSTTSTAGPTLQSTTSLGLTLGKISTSTTAPTTQGGLSTAGGGLSLGLAKGVSGIATTTTVGGQSAAAGGLKLPTSTQMGALPGGGLSSTAASTLGGGGGGLKLGGLPTTTSSAPTSQSGVKGLGGVDPATITGKGKNTGYVTHVYNCSHRDRCPCL